MTTNHDRRGIQAGTERRMEPEAGLKQTGVRVKLIGTDGNAFALLGRVRQALRRAGCGEGFVKAFTAEATRGDYQHLLAVIAGTVEVE